MLPLECVVRGYLAGSGWKDYKRTGAVCGIPLPDGPARGRPAAAARSSRRRRRPRAGTTRTSAPSRASSSSAPSATARSSASSIALYERAAAAALRARDHPGGHEVRVRDRRRRRARGRRRGADARLVALLAGRQLRARLLAAVLRQAVRARLARDAADWDKTPPGPELPDEVRDGTAARYREAYERLAGRPFASLPRRDGGARVKVTVLVRPKEGILDPQGEAIRQALTTLGYPASSVRAGRVFDVELDVERCRRGGARRPRGRRPRARERADRGLRGRGRGLRGRSSRGRADEPRRASA